MARNQRTVVSLLSLVLVLSSSSSISLSLAASPARPRGDTSADSSFLSPQFTATLRSTAYAVQKLVALVSTFSGPLFGIGDHRVSSAVQDCLDLLSLSSDELDWSLSTSSVAASTAAVGAGGSLRVGTGNHLVDLRSWLSGALGNQGTCAEGFDGTSGVAKTVVVGGLGTVTSLLTQALQQIPAAVGGNSGRGRRLLSDLDTARGFPLWMGTGTRRLMQGPPSSLQPNAVVAADGSGDYTTVGEAVNAAPQQSDSKYVIYVKAGVYPENLDIKKKKWNIVLVGDGMGATVITGSRNFVDGWTTFRTATFAVAGKGFIARDLTIENTAGPEKHQAVAFRSDSDLSAYFQVEFKGYQDTLYAHSLRQFYRECRISGTVDFIFGNAAAVFQSCQILARRPLSNQKNTITAHGRNIPEQNTGFSFQGCNFTADDDLAADLGSGTAAPTYLGRPWKEYSRTVVMESELGPEIRPEGWLEWSGSFALSTLYYGEYMNSGGGSGVDGRVNWPGYHVITDPAEATNFTVAQFIDGNMWLPATGVRYTAGLSE